MKKNVIEHTMLLGIIGALFQGAAAESQDI